MYSTGMIFIFEAGNLMKPCMMWHHLVNIKICPQYRSISIGLIAGGPLEIDESYK
jgi:hypothetical protein